MRKVQKHRAVTIFLPGIDSQEMLFGISNYRQFQEIKTISGLLNDDKMLDGTGLGGLILAR